MDTTSPTICEIVYSSRSTTMQASPRSAELLARIGFSEVLFKEKASRREMSRLRPGWPLRTLKIRVHRNHSFEHVASAMTGWAAYAGLCYEWSEAPYDDSLSMSVRESSADLEMVWFDVAPLRSKPDIPLLGWLRSRVNVLRGLSSSPILVAIIGLSEVEEAELSIGLVGIPGVRVAPVAKTLVTLSSPFDPRLLKISGSRLSDAANILLAKHLACRWVPAQLYTRIKAVIVDLDQTLYSGVLGEDGMNVKLTPAHASLQASLVALKQSGVFLGVVSKNVRADVEELFQKRQDFPLRLADFSAIEIGWGSKAESILRASRTLKIDPSAVLFVDDNPGELIEVAERLAGVCLIHASPDVARTVNELDFFPGLWSWNISSTDALRIADLNAEASRKRIQLTSADKAAYLRELAPQIDVWLNSPKLLPRLHELSQKTNQFNLALARLDELRVNDFACSSGRFVVGVGLKDRLSDSGVVAAMFGRIHYGEVVVEEWVISCRALGRELEGLMAKVALTAVAPKATSASFIYRKGQRNMPAMEWLARASGSALYHEGKAVVDIAALYAVAESPVSIIIHSDERPKLS